MQKASLTPPIAGRNRVGAFDAADPLNRWMLRGPFCGSAPRRLDTETSIWLVFLPTTLRKIAWRALIVMNGRSVIFQKKRLLPSKGLA